MPMGTTSWWLPAPASTCGLGQRIRVRLADVEYQVWPGFTFGSLHPYGISAGISFQVLGSRDQDVEMMPRNRGCLPPPTCTGNVRGTILRALLQPYAALGFVVEKGHVRP